MYRLVARLCSRLNVREPRLLVADLGAPNALSLGGPRRGVVVLDRGLLSLLTADELEGILAHELAHMERYDTFLKTLFVTAGRLLVGLVSLPLAPVLVFLLGVDRAIAWFTGRPRRRRFGFASRFQLGAQIALGLFVFPLTLLLLAHSRRREYAADERAVDVTGKPTALARALAKIHRASAPRSGLLSLLYIHGRRQTPPPWLSTHPPVDRRIERLLARSGAESGGRRIDRLRP
ncbi:MAG: M48 family metalloprotease [Halovenus sp.]